MSAGEEGFGIAHTPEQVRRLRLALNTLASGSAGSALKDLADDVLSGKVELRNVLQSRAYDDVMTERVQKFSNWYHALSESERQAEAQRARDAMSDLSASFDACADFLPAGIDTPRRREPVNDDDYFERNSWLR